MTVQPEYPTRSQIRNTAEEPDTGFSCAQTQDQVGNGQGRRPLDNNANKGANTGQGTFSLPDAGDLQRAVAQEKQQDARRDRYRAREILWSLSTLKRVKLCGRCSCRKNGTVDLVTRSLVGADGQVTSTHRAGFDGIATCGSVWSCPVCSASIQSERTAQVATLLKWAAQKGYTVVFETATLRHHKGQSLTDLWSGLGTAWSSMRTSGSYRRFQKRNGYLGYIRAVEVTHGDNGWHPHIHSFHIFDLGGIPQVSTPEWDAYEERCASLVSEMKSTRFASWAYGAHKAGLGAPLERAFDVQVVHKPESARDYISKAVYDDSKNEKALRKQALELQSAGLQKGKQGGRTPFELLRSVVEDGLADDLDLWNEYEKASKGRRALTWSRGLKKLCGAEEVSDLDEWTEPEVHVTLADWKRDLSKKARLQTQVLEVAEDNADTAQIEEFCQVNGIELMDVNHPHAVRDREDHRFMKDERTEEEIRLAKLANSWTEHVEAEERADADAVTWWRRWVDDSVCAEDGHHLRNIYGMELLVATDPAIDKITELVLAAPVEARWSLTTELCTGAPSRVLGCVWGTVKMDQEFEEERQFDAQLREIQEGILGNREPVQAPTLATM